MNLFKQVFQGELEPITHDVHPSFTLLLELAADVLEPPASSKISAHLATCKRCRNELVEIREEFRRMQAGFAKLLPDPLRQPTVAGVGEYRGLRGIILRTGVILEEELSRGLRLRMVRNGSKSLGEVLLSKEFARISLDRALPLRAVPTV
ncbi:MAG: hypothetical protein ACE5JP_02170 [Candidatus Bipolaricaulia bacterium]